MMHPVIKSHLEAFAKEYDLTKRNIDKQFEAFVNYCVISQFYWGHVDPSDHIYDGDDPGIDGILFIIDGELVSSTNEAVEIFNKPKKDMDVIICFTQAKTGESWKKSEINVFESAIIDFIKSESLYPQDEYLKERKEIFNLVVSNLRKVKGGKPKCFCYYATTGRYKAEREISAAFETLSRNLDDIGYFTEISTIKLDRDKLIEYWVQSYSPIDVSLTILSSAAFPKCDGIKESYVVTVKAREFIDKVLTDEHNNLRKSIFEENVRDFLGLESRINKEIAKTLSDENSRERFGVLNNGITIVSPDIRLQSTELYMENFQIVNGCQTSNVLYENNNSINENVTLTLKVIETTDDSIVDDIVRATNSQTKVEDYQFLATLTATKNIEKYFLARDDDEKHKLYFARRHRQFAQHGIPSIRIFDIRDIARCAGAMFFDRPDLSTRYPNQLTSELKNLVFDINNRDEIYYTSAYAMYRLGLHFSNYRIPLEYKKFKWYILMAIKYYVFGKNNINVQSKKIVNKCDEIISIMKSNNEREIEKVLLCCSIFDKHKDVTKDQMKRQKFVHKVKEELLTMRKGRQTARRFLKVCTPQETQK